MLFPELLEWKLINFPSSTNDIRAQTTSQSGIEAQGQKTVIPGNRLRKRRQERARMEVKKRGVAERSFIKIESTEGGKKEFY